MHRADKREVQGQTTSAASLSTLRVSSVPLARFRVIEPYREAILWISLEAKHYLKQFDSLFSLGC